jgi:D-serine dehydratase
MLLNIAATDRTPEIVLSAQPAKLSIKGESYPEDVSAFYGQIIQKVNSLVESPLGPLSVEIQLIYINSSSIKALFRIFEVLDEYQKKDQAVMIQWLLDEDDDIMQELGEDFIDRFPNLKITVKSI